MKSYKMSSVTTIWHFFNYSQRFKEWEHLSIHVYWSSAGEGEILWARAREIPLLTMNHNSPHWLHYTRTHILHVLHKYLEKCWKSLTGLKADEAGWRKITLKCIRHHLVILSSSGSTSQCNISFKPKDAHRKWMTRGPLLQRGMQNVWRK